MTKFYSTNELKARDRIRTLAFLSIMNFFQEICRTRKNPEDIGGYRGKRETLLAHLRRTKNIKRYEELSDNLDFD